MREEHPDLENPLDHVTITPFQIYDQLLHNKEKLRAHEGLWIKNFNLINKGLNRRQENGKKELKNASLRVFLVRVHRALVLIIGFV